MLISPERRLFFIILISIVLVASACAPRIKRPEERVVSIQALLDCLPETPPETVVARGRFSLSWRGVAGGSYDGVLFYMRPNRLKLSLYAPFGITLYEVLINSEGLYMIFPTDGVVKHKEMAMSDLLLSRKLFQRGGYTLYFDNTGYWLERPDIKSQNEWVERYLFDPSTLCLKEIWYKLPDGGKVSVSEGEFHQGVPKRLSISMKGYKMDITLSEITTGITLDETLFSIPQNFRIEPLEY